MPYQDKHFDKYGFDEGEWEAFELDQEFGLDRKLFSKSDPFSAACGLFLLGALAFFALLSVIMLLAKYLSLLIIGQKSI